MSQPPEIPPPGGWPAPPGWPPTTPQQGLDPRPPLSPPAGGPGMTLPPGWRPQRPDTKPGVIPLRPLGVDDYLSGTFATVRGHWRPLLAVAAAVAAVVAILALPLLFAAEPLVRDFIAISAMDPNASNAEAEAAFRDLGHTFVAFLPWLVLGFIGQTIAVAVIDAGAAIVVSGAVIGKPITSWEVMSQLVRLIPRLLLLGLLLSIGLITGFALCIIPGLFLTFSWFAAPAALAMENGSVVGSMRRSWSLVSKNFWRVVGLLVVVQIGYGFVLQLIVTPVGLITSLGAFGGLSETVPTQGAVDTVLFGYFAIGLLALLSYPIVGVARSLEYIDLRMRHEQLADALVEASK